MEINAKDHLYGVRVGTGIIVYLVGMNKCQICDMNLNECAIYYFNRKFLNRSIQSFAICPLCFQNISGEYIAFGTPEFNLCIISEKPPKNAFRLLGNTVLQFSKTIPEAVDEPAVHIINRCKYAGRPGYTLEPNVQIGKSVEQLEIEQLKEQEELDTLGIDGYLGQFMPTIEDKTEKLKQIEEKKCNKFLTYNDGEAYTYIIKKLKQIEEKK